MRNVTRPLVLIMGLALLAVTGCKAVGAPGSAAYPGGDVLQPSQARAEAAALLPRFLRAWALEDSAAMKVVASPPVLSQEMSQFAQDAPTRTAPPDPEAYTATEIKIAVPHQSAYPAHFVAVAIMRTPDYQPFLVYAEFTKAAAGTPSTIDRYISLDQNADVPALAVDSQGFAYEVSTALQLSMLGLGASDLSGGWVDDVNQVIQNGALVTTHFAPTGDTTGIGYNAHNSQQVASAQSGNGGLSSGFDSVADNGIALRTADGGILEAFTADELVTRSTTPGYVYTQDSARQSFGGLLAPGQYSSYTTTYRYSVLAHAPAKGSVTKPEAIGVVAFAVSATGRP